MNATARQSGYRSQLEQFLLTEPTVFVDLLEEYPGDTDRRTWLRCNWQGYETQRAKLKILWQQDGIIGEVSTLWNAPFVVATLPKCAVVYRDGVFCIPAQLSLSTQFRGMSNQVVVNFLLFPAEF